MVRTLDNPAGILVCPAELPPQATKLLVAPKVEAVKKVKRWINRTLVRPRGINANGRVFSLPSSGGYAFRVKAPEDWRSPKAVANFDGSVRREASWIAPVLWRFLTGAMALNTSGGERWGEEVVRW